MMRPYQRARWFVESHRGELIECVDGDHCLAVIAFNQSPDMPLWQGYHLVGYKVIQATWGQLHWQAGTIPFKYSSVMHYKIWMHDQAKAEGRTHE